MDLREHEPLKHHTTLRTGGPARCFLEVRTENEFLLALDFARDQRLPVFVLGGGSNVLADERGFDGLVVKVGTRGIRVRETAPGHAEVVAESGEIWDDLVAYTVESGWRGLENLSLIPGTVGGGVVGNIGAYGAEVADSLVWLEAIDVQTREVRRFTLPECEFGYRWSFFKAAPGRNYVVTRAAFALRKDGRPNLVYQELAQHLASKSEAEPTLREVREAVVTIRRRKLPDVEQVGTAGSFFKNPRVTRQGYEVLVRRYPVLPGHPEADGRIKLPLGWILDKVCGLKGFRQGRVGTHPEQALVIVNEGGTADEVEALANHIAGEVRLATGLEIEWEVERLYGLGPFC
jgi:UDP-N-acetylmuramate dehydrogenase